jgi:para-nitrobenzyl esterase
MRSFVATQFIAACLGIAACRGAAPAPQNAPPPPGLAGTAWRLVRFQGGDGATLTPDDREKYACESHRDGSLSARIDCNRGHGTWKSSGNQLELGTMALTRAMCPPGSLHDRIVMDLSYVRSYVIKDSHLFLSLMADAGIYELEPIPPEQPASK